jgi:hypothetical protein
MTTWCVFLSENIYYKNNSCLCLLYAVSGYYLFQNRGVLMPQAVVTGCAAVLGESC